MDRFCLLLSFQLYCSYLGNKLGIPSAHRITFPQNNEFDKECVLDDGTIGSCVSYGKCITLHSDKHANYVKTCYFERFEQFVCCGEKSHQMKIPVPSSSILPPLLATESAEQNKPASNTATDLPGFLKINRTTTSASLPTFVLLNRTTTSPPGIPHPDFPALPPIDELTTTGSASRPTPPALPMTSTSNKRAAKPCSEPPEFRITVVLGLKTQPEEFPFMIALGWQTFEENVYDYRCGGVLIAEDYVLTAAHCAYSQELPPVVALPGGVHLNSTNRVYGIKRVIEHPDYDPNLSYHDIALMELEEPIKARDLKPICLFDSNSIRTDDGNVTAIGYGHTRFACNSSNELLKAYLQVIDNEECKKFYVNDETLPRGLIDQQLCARDPEKLRDTCQGDSGGPLVTYTGLDTAYVLGITSFGQACALEPPGVYTRVSSYTGWIDSIVWPN